MNSKVKLVVYVPLTHSEQVRVAIGKAGGGKIGNYNFCSFSTRGQGRFRGNENSNPSVGEKGKLEIVEEERIEVTVDRSVLENVIKEMKAVHPYEEIAYDIYPLEN